MSNFSKLVVTKAGINLINDGVITGNKVKFVRMIASDAKYAANEVGNLTELESIKHSADIRSAEKTAESVITVDAIFNSNENLTEGYFIRTIGLIASIGSEEILFAVAVEQSENPAYMTPTAATTSSMHVKFNIKLESEGNIEIIVDPAGTATIGDIVRIEEKLQAHASDEEIHVTSEDRENWNNTLASAKKYTDEHTKEEIAKLVGTAPETLDTFEEVANAFKENDDVVKALNSAIGNKADKEIYGEESVNLGRLQDSEAGEKSSTLSGEYNIASGSYSVAWGNSNTASGNYSCAGGSSTQAKGDYSHAEGFSCTASGRMSHVEGVQCSASGEGAHAEGNISSSEGEYAHAEGYHTTVLKDAKAGHAEGGMTDVDGEYAHAEGYRACAGANYSHAEGFNTRAYGQASHAEGYSTNINSHLSSDLTDEEIIKKWEIADFSLAKGHASHVEGANCLALGSDSHAEGTGTIAAYSCQHVQGKYNDNQEENLFEIGNGEDFNKRSNAFAVDKEGNAKAAKDVSNGNGVSLDGLNSYLGKIKSSSVFSPKLRETDFNNFPTDFPNPISIITTTGSVLNAPENLTATGITLQLIYDENSIVQVFFGVGTSKCFKRVRTGTETWSEWIRFID